MSDDTAQPWEHADAQILNATLQLPPGRRPGAVLEVDEENPRVELVTEYLRDVPSRFGVAAAPPVMGEKLGIAKNVKAKPRQWPLNGLRHPPGVGTCGWFLWAGSEYPEALDLWVPLHVDHINDWCPEALPYLNLPPGWRFLIAPGYEDVWFDQSLLDI